MLVRLVPVGRTPHDAQSLNYGGARKKRKRKKNSCSAGPPCSATTVVLVHHMYVPCSRSQVGYETLRPGQLQEFHGAPVEEYLSVALCQPMGLLCICFNIMNFPLAADRRTCVVLFSNMTSSCRSRIGQVCVRLEGLHI